MGSSNILPVGFRFHPTDEELITHYLSRKLSHPNLQEDVIAELPVYKFQPWDLPSKAKHFNVEMDDECYFFNQTEWKHSRGTTKNRKTPSGYWQLISREKRIIKRKGSSTVVGMRQTREFRLGKPPKGTDTNWIMHEYMLEGELPPNISSSERHNWMVCKIFKGQRDVRVADTPDTVLNGAGEDDPDIGHDHDTAATHAKFAVMAEPDQPQVTANFALAAGNPQDFNHVPIEPGQGYTTTPAAALNPIDSAWDPVLTQFCSEALPGIDDHPPPVPPLTFADLGISTMDSDEVIPLTLLELDW